MIGDPRFTGGPPLRGRHQEGHRFSALPVAAQSWLMHYTPYVSKFSQSMDRAGMISAGRRTSLLIVIPSSNDWRRFVCFSQPSTGLWQQRMASVLVVDSASTEAILDRWPNAPQSPQRSPHPWPVPARCVRS